MSAGTLTPEALHAILRERFGLSPAMPLKLAYSGGLDSSVLLHLLAALHERSGWPLSAVHVHHGLSPHADQWAQHCAQSCRALGVSLAVETVQVDDGAGEGPEAAARRARYKALARHVEQDDVLVTAQHQRDQAETLLLRLLRGAGCRGMAAMPAVSRFHSGWLVRPLLEIPHELLVDYARDHRLSWVEDEMNQESALGRGFLRTEIMPVLRRRWPQTDVQLARAAQHAAEAAMLLDEVAEQDLDTCRIDDGDHLSVHRLRELSLMRCKNALRRWFGRAGLSPPSTRLLAQVVRMVQRTTMTRRAIVREHAMDVRRYRDTLYLATANDEHRTDWQAEWDPVAPLALPNGRGWLRGVPDQGKGISIAKLTGHSLRVRFRQGGETCRLPGRHHHHKVKKLLQEAGIPPWERHHLPLVYVQDELAAIGERWVCEPFAAVPGEPGLRLEIVRNTD